MMGVVAQIHHKKEPQMKNKMTYLIVVFGLLVVFAGGLMYQQVSAQRSSLKEILKLGPADNVQQETIDVIVESDFSNSVYVSSEQKTKNDEVITTAKEFLTKSSKTYQVLLSPGWLHIQSKIETPFPRSTTLPDGSPIPTESMNDNWALLGDAGYVIKSVTIDDTGDPRTTQITVFQDGIWTHLSLGVMSQEKETYQISFDHEFISFAEANKDILNLDKTEEVLNGEEAVIVFSATQMFKEPMAYGKSSVTFAGTGARYYFSAVTGTLRLVEEFNVYPDGTIEIFRRVTTLLIERVDTPPDEILAYFTK